MKKVCQELIDFFEQGEGWDKAEILEDFNSEILQEVGCIFSADELGINDGEKDVMVLQDFTERLFDKILEGVCNVIKTA